LNPAHSSHDALLVARYAAGDAYPGEAAQARQLVNKCAQCAELAADIRTISARTSELRAAKRPRDFRITAEQAEQLRGSWLDRLLRGFAAPGWTVVRPLAGAALAIALVVVVIGALPLSNLARGSVPEAANGTTTQVAAGQGSPQNVFDAPTANDSGAVKPQNDDASAPPPAASAASVDMSASQTPAAAQATGAGEILGPGEAIASNEPVTVPGPNTAAASPQIAPEPTMPVPPKSVDTPRAAASEAPSGVVVVPPAFVVPSSPPEALVLGGHVLVSADHQSTIDRTALVAGGLIIGFLALMALVAVWLIRRRYSDPLIR